ncbi:hypothetical protein NBRC10512_002882 [Rhodotorula toruloides]|uniref:RHTO0S13e04302g1_1 n=2 Tax=Rhodotorula toruloides TaxID=5286 RepID=A0A061BAK8_RHOTO|nr:phosphatidylinositol N-acetylglucosaminyltransferase subunit P [Rhodotorula toruloides NP11]EMS22400.1 phosphatidylinositol N-acetylglucosaminyltransferase subunit P [Rhodotorula toruloides NP11]CDR46975.1 RHTO0S13e04302g1_1 [Rhodotorula toruloides]
MHPRTLRASASASSLPRLPSSYAASSHNRRAADALAQPTLADLIQAEERAFEQDDLANVGGEAVRRVRQRRRSSAPGIGVAGDVTPPRPRLRTSETSPVASPVPQNDLLLPPHYGRPNRPSSPDVLAALLRPVLQSLSRPSSPALSPVVPGTPAPSSPTKSLDVTSPLLAEPPADRSASSLPAQFPPREPTDPAPTVESQGFVLYIGSHVAYFAYLAWACLPEPWLEAIGIEWYPSRDWALLVPAWIVMLVAFVYVSYFLLNMHNTPSLTSLSLLDDPRAFVTPPPRPPANSKGVRRPPTPLWAHAVLAEEDAIPPLYDLPIEVVNRVLYGDEGQG